MQRLNCHVKEYAWGKKGEESEVANLFAAGHSDFTVGKNTPYAELWMGTHPDGPARLESSGTRLSSHIAKSVSAQYLSNNNLKEDIHLPFIMKVMSIRHTLSLQVHPTKEQAERLHEEDPVHYPDRHHKPELAYALTRFELLCGFRPANEMVANIKAFPALRALMGEQNCATLVQLIESGQNPRNLKCRSALAACFKHQLDTQQKNSERVEGLLEELMAQIDNGVRGALSESTVAVIRKMCVDFPGDVGIFSPLYLNHMVLQPGECCYYAAQELHAYLSGECVECVGCSNNTIRAALTPKFIDRENLCTVLNYNMTAPEEYLLPPKTLEQHPIVDEYAPDCKDFQLHRIRLSPSTPLPSTLPPLQCASIMVIVSGEGMIDEICTPTVSGLPSQSTTVDRQSVKRGDIIYIPPGRRLAFSSCTEDIEAYRTFSFEIGPDHEIKSPEAMPLSSPSQKLSSIPVRKGKMVEKTPFTVSIQREDSGMFDVESEMDGFC